jgi:hypothetical protein
MIRGDLIAPEDYRIQIASLQFFNRARYRARARPRSLKVAGEDRRKDVWGDAVPGTPRQAKIGVVSTGRSLSFVLQGRYDRSLARSA